jgi:hypothetical protein
MVFIMALVREVFALYYLLTQIIPTGLVLLWNVRGNRAWTFWEKEDGK